MTSANESNDRNWKLILPFLLAYTLLVISALEQPFFWDTLTQASKWAHWYYNHQFDQFFLPPSLDAGHPPFFAMGLALLWSLFGKSLWISHLAVLPLVLGILWQLYRLISRTVPRQYRFWVFLLLASDSTLLAQSTLVSPDLSLCFGTLLTLNGLLERKYTHSAIGALFFGLVSIRGIFVMVSFLIFIIARPFIRSKDTPKDSCLLPVLSLLPAALLMAAYYICHYMHSGWLLSVPDGAWAGHRTWVGPGQVLRNAGILGWRLLDFGKIAVWGILVFGLVRAWYKKNPVLDQPSRMLSGYVTSFLVAFAPAFLLISNPVAHRYLLPVYLLLALIAARLLIAQNLKSGLFKMVIAGMLIIQLSGNFWVYPRHIAQGWDASLAYRPYFELREQMIEYLDGRNISLNEVGSDFPNVGAVQYIDLSDRTDGFVAYDPERQSYILYSNIYNDFADQDLYLLEKEWTIEKSMERRGVELILYKKQAE